MNPANPSEPLVDQRTIAPGAVAQSIGQHQLTLTRRTEVTMPKGKLSPEGEVIAAYGAAMVAAFQVLINCLEENDGSYPDSFRPRSAFIWKW